MDEKKSQERNAFLAGVEENFQRGDFETILMTAGLRLKRMPGDLDARLAICRARIEQGALGEAGDLLSEVERILAGLDRVCALLRELGRQTGLTDETRALFEKFGLAAPAGAAMEIPADSRDRLVRRETKEAPEARAEAAEPAEAGTPQRGDVATGGEASEAPEDFLTVTLAELYIRQGHLRQAESVLEKIVRREPQNDRAAGLLRDVRGRLQPATASPGDAAVAAELSRWLDNVGRLRGHAT